MAALGSGGFQAPLEDIATQLAYSPWMSSAGLKLVCASWQTRARFWALFWRSHSDRKLGKPKQSNKPWVNITSGHRLDSLLCSTLSNHWLYNIQCYIIIHTLFIYDISTLSNHGYHIPPDIQHFRTGYVPWLTTHHHGCVCAAPRSVAWMAATQPVPCHGIIPGVAVVLANSRDL